MAQVILREARRNLCESIKKSGISSYRLEADELLSFVCGIKKNEFFCRADYALSDCEQRLLSEVTSRRIDGEPCAYIIGEWDFYSRTFKITPDVLIPRQDTEAIIDAVLAHMCERMSMPLNILDLCCGSGCIGIVLADYFKNSHLTLCDISRAALDIALQNSRIHGISDRVSAVKSDMFASLDGKFDLIVCNPPYIKSSDIASLDASVREFEPHGALDGGIDGLDFYRQIACSASDFLNKNGALFTECGYNQAQDIINIFNSCGAFAKTETIKDLSGISRVVYGFN